MAAGSKRPNRQTGAARRHSLDRKVRRFSSHFDNNRQLPCSIKRFRTAAIAFALSSVGKSWYAREYSASAFVMSFIAR
jgi:hypothetical protein